MNSNRPHLVLAGIISALTIAIGAACTPTTVVDEPGVEASVNNGASDVKIKTCAKTEFGMSVTLDVKNSTNKVASYFINLEAVTGTKRVGEASTAVNSLRPGQSTSTSAVGGLEEGVDKIECKIVEVTRTP